jgi:hypothetical protein
MSKRIEELLTQIQAAPGCQIKAPTRLPQIEAPFRLPDDLREFYQICGGLTLAENTKYALTIVSADHCVPANPVLLGEVAELARLANAEDISWSWYILADYGNGDYITIDLAPQRLGRCYDSSHETHGLRGETPIIALSFTDLLASLFQTRGQYWYWLQRNFVPLGDAYGEGT